MYKYLYIVFMVTIYKIVSPSNKIYIGQTINLQRRIKEYKRKTCKSQCLLCNSLLKYGLDNHTIEIVEVTDIDQADNREIYWIKQFNSYNSEQGLNLTEGGKRPAPRFGKEHHNAKTVHQYDFEGNYIQSWDCIRDVQKKYGWNSITIGMSIKAGTSAYNYQWSFKLEEKQPYVPNKGGIKNKIIYQFSMDGELINQFQSILSAMKSTGIDRRTIRNSLNKKILKRCRSHYKWSYNPPAQLP
jgi:group I intron endonuclease